MAIAAATVWEVRGQTGADTNGGAFVAGATGSDFSQQGAKNTVGNNISTTDAVAAATTTLTSATASFTAAIVGNIIYLSGGTGALAAAWYQVATFTNATTVVLDRAPGVSTGVTMNIGGALASVNQVMTNIIAANKAFVRADGTYVMTAGAASAVGTASSASTPSTTLQGYSTVRGDSGRATLQLSTNTGLTALAMTGSFFTIQNMIIDGNSLGTSSGITFSTSAGAVINTTVKNCTTRGIGFTAGGAVILQCEVTGCSSAATGAITNGNAGGLFHQNYIHDNACPGISSGAGNDLISENIIANNTGASSDGYVSTSGGANAIHNTIYGNGRHGINFTSNSGFEKIFYANILSNNGGFGINFSTTAGTRASLLYDGNAFFNNTSGTTQNMNDTTVNKQNGVGPYVYAFNLTASSSPFVNAAGADWRLNQNGTGGGLFRGLSVPQSWVGLSDNKSFPDPGANQHQDPGFAS